METQVNFTAEERNSLKYRYTIQIEDLNLKIARAQQKLDQRVERQELDRINLEALKTDLQRAQNLLAYLNDMNADQAMIDDQQQVVTKLTDEVYKQNKGIQALTKTEIALQEIEIEDMQNKVQHRIDKIALMDGAPMQAA